MTDSFNNVSLDSNIQRNLENFVKNHDFIKLYKQYVWKRDTNRVGDTWE